LDNKKEVLTLENFYSSILEEMNAINESQLAFHNIERSLMLEEHDSIINEGISDIARNIKEAITKVLRQVRDIITRFFNWVRGQFSKFIKAVKDEMERQKKEERDTDSEEDEEEGSQTMGGSSTTGSTTQKGTVDDGVDYDLSSDLLMLSGPSNPKGGNSFKGAGKKKSPRGKKGGTTQTSGPKRYNSQLNLAQAKRDLDNAIQIIFTESKKIFVDMRQITLDDYKVVENRAKLDALRHQVKEMMNKSSDLKDVSMQDRPTVYTTKDYNALLKLKKDLLDSMERDKKLIERAVKMLQNSHNGLSIAISNMEGKESVDFAQKKYESYYNLSTTLLNTTTALTSNVFGTVGKKAKILNEITRAIKAVK
jgi:hypothetical protein